MRGLDREVVDEWIAPAAREDEPGRIGELGGETGSHPLNAVDEAPQDPALQGRPGGGADRRLRKVQGDVGQLGGAGLKGVPHEDGPRPDRPAPVGAGPVHHLVVDGCSGIHHDDAPGRVAPVSGPPGGRRGQPVGAQRVGGVVVEREGEGHFGGNDRQGGVHDAPKPAGHGVGAGGDDGHEPRVLDRRVGKGRVELRSPVGGVRRVGVRRVDGEDADELVAREKARLHGTVSDVEGEKHVWKGGGMKDLAPGRDLTRVHRFLHPVCRAQPQGPGLRDALHGAREGLVGAGEAQGQGGPEGGKALPERAAD